MIIGDKVIYTAADDIHPAYAGREYAAVVTEVDALDPDTVGLFVFWTTYAFTAWMPIMDGAVPRDDGPTPAPHTWRPAP